MNKPFSITFDLSNIQIQIPSGRLMNLKDRLNWNDIEFNNSDLQDALKAVTYENFNVDVNYIQKSEEFIKQTMEDASKKKSRLDTYLLAGKTKIVRPEYFSQTAHNLIEDFRDELKDLQKIVVEDELIKAKMKKLATLKAINAV